MAVGVELLAALIVIITKIIAVVAVIVVVAVVVTVVPIPLAARSKACVFDRSLAGIAGSKTARSMDVCLL
jgi:hypothetical protein